ncbi:BlaI/MecI/CopY family transcriptional regulator [Microbacterium sp. NIBRBAC000506063]|uniref:BlaI/MecI/CopY family transcriptional regulator n=1 Tax=Microbacterium sp. NIBRBAC000506063 TaxID=2734618 RepID=UPI001BB6AA63|nr:BlaI/MecI/CopY family transcriptional regulator [Microbacterium sp. NIBRBAC000506063]QTV80354.1 BlaI/MecI/CopY family transcriptional regulator [Microbacterium sp. NIBRBAC000506063]
MAGQRTRERGELEGEVMRILWERDELLSARDVQALFSGHTPAYTTLMTALDRLEKKGQVVRSGESPRKVRFRAARSGDEHASREMASALDAAGDRQAALLRFAGNLAAEDLELLRQAIAPRKSR